MSRVDDSTWGGGPSVVAEGARIELARPYLGAHGLASTRGGPAGARPCSIHGAATDGRAPSRGARRARSESKLRNFSARSLSARWNASAKSSPASTQSIARRTASGCWACARGRATILRSAEAISPRATAREPAHLRRAVGLRRARVDWIGWQQIAAECPCTLQGECRPPPLGDDHLAL